MAVNRKFSIEECEVEGALYVKKPMKFQVEASWWRISHSVSCKKEITTNKVYACSSGPWLISKKILFPINPRQENKVGPKIYLEIQN